MSLTDSFSKLLISLMLKQTTMSKIKNDNQKVPTQFLGWFFETVGVSLGFEGRDSLRRMSSWWTFCTSHIRWNTKWRRTIRRRSFWRCNSSFTRFDPMSELNDKSFTYWYNSLIPSIGYIRNANECLHDNLVKIFWIQLSILAWTPYCDSDNWENLWFCDS